MKIQTIEAKNLIVKSKLPASDYVVNPYVGCSHQCRYCYASFMKRFTGHSEAWGTFVDIKQCPHTKFPRNLSQKTLLFSSVTDPYQPLEKKYGATRKILTQLIGIPAKTEILTKSYLVTQDINLFKQLSNVRIGISMNSLDDSFRKDMEPGASPVAQRIKALRELHEAGFSTYAFLSPVFPGITDIELLVDTVAPYVEEICFENLNLRGVQIKYILSYIQAKYPSLVPLYQKIYLQHQTDYWETMENLIYALSFQYPVKFTNYFYHNKIKKGATK